MRIKRMNATTFWRNYHSRAHCSMRSVYKESLKVGDSHEAAARHAEEEFKNRYERLGDADMQHMDTYLLWYETFRKTVNKGGYVEAIPLFLLLPLETLVKIRAFSVSYIPASNDREFFGFILFLEDYLIRSHFIMGKGRNHRRIQAALKQLGVKTDKLGTDYVYYEHR